MKYYLIAIIIAYIFFVIIHKIGKNKKPFKKGIISMLIGLISLIGVNITSVFTGVSLPFSMLTITVALIGGLPGVTTLLGLNLFF